MIIDHTNVRSSDERLIPRGNGIGISLWDCWWWEPEKEAEA